MVSYFYCAVLLLLALPRGRGSYRLESGTSVSFQTSRCLKLMHTHTHTKGTVLTSSNWGHEIPMIPKGVATNLILCDFL